MCTVQCFCWLIKHIPSIGNTCPCRRLAITEICVNKGGHKKKQLSAKISVIWFGQRQNAQAKRAQYVENDNKIFNHRRQVFSWWARQWVKPAIGETGNQ